MVRQQLKIAGAALRRILPYLHIAPLVGVIAMAATTLPVSAADNLRAALALAYQTNPELQAERFQLRATDERLPQAQAGWRPTVEASSSFGYKQENDSSSSTTKSDPFGFKITLRQPIFRGFRTQSATAQARQVIEAGRQDLLQIEQSVLLRAVAAYMNILRDRDIVRLRYSQIGVLRAELKAANGRFSLGEVTRTDVAQALTRYQSAIANHNNAKADLGVGVGEFIRHIGRAPGSLKRPGRPGKLPRNLERAIRTAERHNPEIRKAEHKEEAARHFVKVRRGSLLPRVALEAEYGYNAALSVSEANTESAVVRGVLTIPLYQSGTAYSGLRQAKEQASRRRVLILNARRKVRSQVMRVWNRYREASTKIRTVKSQVGSAMLAVEGVRREAQAGSRTTQDTLDAERELMNTRISLAIARRDQVVRAYELLAAMGRLTGRDLGLNVTMYDPQTHGDAVDGKWFGASTTSE